MKDYPQITQIPLNSLDAQRCLETSRLLKEDQERSTKAHETSTKRASWLELLRLKLHVSGTKK